MPPWPRSVKELVATWKARLQQLLGDRGYLGGKGARSISRVSGTTLLPARLGHSPGPKPSIYQTKLRQFGTAACGWSFPGTRNPAASRTETHQAVAPGSRRISGGSTESKARRNS